MDNFGPIIPHTSGEACPFPDAVGVVIFRNGSESRPRALGDWAWNKHDSGYCITAYRLPADHHAYGPRVSRMGREPDAWMNEYGAEAVWITSSQHAKRIGANEAAALAHLGRIGVWRIYHKPAAAQAGA